MIIEVTRNLYIPFYKTKAMMKYHSQHSKGFYNYAMHCMYCRLFFQTDYSIPIANGLLHINDAVQAEPLGHAAV